MRWVNIPQINGSVSRTRREADTHLWTPQQKRAIHKWADMRVLLRDEDVPFQMEGEIIDLLIHYNSVILIF